MKSSYWKAFTSLVRGKDAKHDEQHILTLNTAAAKHSLLQVLAFQKSLVSQEKERDGKKIPIS